MFQWVFSPRLRKWWFLIMLLIGPPVAYVFWQDGEHLRLVEATGTPTTAETKAIVARTGRSLTQRYTIDLSWTDTAGRQRSANNVPISNIFAGKIAKDGKLTTTRVPIKYLADRADKQPVVTPDRREQENFNWLLAWTAAILGAIGLVGTVATFGFGRAEAA